MLELEPTDVPTERGPTERGGGRLTASRVGTLVVAAATYVVGFGVSIYAAIVRFGEGTSTQPFTWDTVAGQWAMTFVAVMVFTAGTGALWVMNNSDGRVWWSWPKWTRRAPLSPSTYLACVSVFVLSVSASFGIARVIESVVWPSSPVDSTSPPTPPFAAVVLEALYAGVSEEVIVVAVPVAALAMWLGPTRAGLIAALCVLVPMRLAYHVYYGTSVTIGLSLWAAVSAYMIWRWRDYRLVIAFALTHAAYNICINYSFAIWVLLGVAAVSVIALAVTHRVRTGRWITMAAPLLVAAPVRA